MRLSLIKSREGLNQNFSNKSQNRIGFKFGFSTRLSFLIITFCSDLGLQWNWLRWKYNKSVNKYVRNNIFQFGCLLCQNHLVIKYHRSGRIWNHFPTWIEFSISTWTKRLSFNFPWISRAFRPLIIFINRPLSFKRMCA
jgi:hypothetical protein